jgi:hypothetical protein
MKKKLWFGAAAAALMAFGLAPASAQDGDQAGDATTQATLSGNVDGEISPAGDTDWFRLQVEQGQRYNLALAGLEGADGQALDPMLSVYDAQGNQLAFNDDANGSLNSALRYVPAQSGTVFVEARAFNSEATGRYRLGVSSEALPADDVGNDASTGGRVAVGRTVTGNIEYEGDFDWYRFSARTGNRYVVSLSGAGEGGLGDPVLRVIDSEGNELAANDDSEGSLNSRLEFVPRANGNVFIEARGYGEGYSGRYELNVTAERLPHDSVGNATSTGGRIRVGQTVTNALDFPSDTDWYRIRLEQGQSYHFTLNSGEGDSALSDPMLALYDSSGAQIGMDDDGGDGLNSYLEFTAPTTGNYYVEARGFAEDASGGYTLTAHAGDVPASVETDASLSADGDYREGALAPASDRDWYRIDLTEGQSLRIGLDSATSGDALGDPLLVLYGPDGAEVSRDDDGGDGLNAFLEYTATAAGPHYVEARGFVDEASGRYVLSITPGEIGSTPDAAQPLQANGDPRTSFIGTPGDVDWFVVEMIEGRPYRINVEAAEPGALADPMLTLYDSTGTQVASDDDGGRGLNAYLSYASPTGGPYFVGVSSYGDEGTGRYQIRMADTDVPGHAYTDESLDAADDARASRIDMPGDVDVYRVTLEAGVTYQIEANAAGQNGLSNPFVAVIQEGAVETQDPAVIRDGGQRVASNDDGGAGRNARLSFRPEAAGDYLIQVSGVGSATGDYEVKIVRQ